MYYTEFMKGVFNVAQVGKVMMREKVNLKGMGRRNWQGPLYKSQCMKGR